MQDEVNNDRREIVKKRKFRNALWWHTPYIHASTADLLLQLKKALNYLGTAITGIRANPTENLQQPVVTAGS